MKMKKVYTVTVKFWTSFQVTTSQSTTDMEQAMRFTASLAEDVESAMKIYGFGRLDALDINISVKNVDEADIPGHTGKWFWCTLNGNIDKDVRDIPSGEDPIDGIDKLRSTLDLASPRLAYKINGRLFEYWSDVVDYCDGKLR